MYVQLHRLTILTQCWAAVRTSDSGKSCETSRGVFAGQPRTSTPGQSQQQSAFARKAGDIGQGIHSTSQKLAKLSQLAKAPPGPFDDNAQAIAALSSAVKQDIQQLNAAIADLQNLSVAAPENGRQSGKHTTTVVGSLRSRLKDATQEFKNVLTVRQENLKTHQGRRQLFSALPDRAKPAGPRGETL